MILKRSFAHCILFSVTIKWFSHYIFSSTDATTLSPMQQFYQNKSVFVTGGSGFLGKVVIEKLLRSCQVDTIYVLIRSKKGKDIATRIEDIMNDVVSI